MLLGGDIGGTKTVLALYTLEQGPHRPLVKETYASKDYDSLEAVIRAFLQDKEEGITHAAFGVAGPVVRDAAHITNLPWVLSERQLQETFDLHEVHLLNDLKAIATAVPILKESDFTTLHAGEPVEGGAIGVVAPGTGLGEAFLVCHDGRYHAFPSEGGHADFAPADALQIDLLRYLQQKHHHVSYERVCSGMGIPNLYAFFRDTGRYSEPDWLRERLAAVSDPTPVIVRAAQADEAAICTATLALFIDILARECGNMALKLLATGGIYLGGGIPPRIMPQLRAHNFVETFTAKGRFSRLLAEIPIYVIENPQTALLGAATDGLKMVAREES
ncbi:MAG: glucokinase [Candidatus Promineifilaceae bacterium]|nr:glucokinase [Candidatus Promineifilaceae bacterium]